MNWINTLTKNTLFRVMFLMGGFLVMLFIRIIKPHNPVATAQYGRMDTKIFYEWGQAWRQGLNAYDPESHLYSKDLNKKINSMAYPPHASLLFISLASVPINIATAIRTNSVNSRSSLNQWLVFCLLWSLGTWWDFNCRC